MFRHLTYLEHNIYSYKMLAANGISFGHTLSGESIANENTFWFTLVKRRRKFIYLCDWMTMHGAYLLHLNWQTAISVVFDNLQYKDRILIVGTPIQ